MDVRSTTSSCVFFCLFVAVHVDVYNRVFLQSSGDATLELASAAH